MRFTSQQDYNSMIRFNKELVNTIVDVSVLIYKINLQATIINVYGEAPTKERWTATQVQCLLSQQPGIATENGGQIDFEQGMVFAFLRESLRDKNVYPEIGDVVEWDNQYFELNTVNEVQKYGGRMEYNHSIVCEAHVTMRRPLQIEAPNV